MILSGLLLPMSVMVPFPVAEVAVMLVVGWVERTALALLVLKDISFP